MNVWEGRGAISFIQRWLHLHVDKVIHSFQKIAWARFPQIQSWISPTSVWNPGANIYTKNYTLFFKCYYVNHYEILGLNFSGESFKDTWYPYISQLRWAYFVVFVKPIPVHKTSTVPDCAWNLKRQIIIHTQSVDALFRSWWNANKIEIHPKVEQTFFIQIPYKKKLKTGCQLRHLIFFTNTELGYREEQNNMSASRPYNEN